MPGLNSPVRIRSSKLPIPVNKLASLFAFLLLLGAGWIAVSYFRSFISYRAGSSGDSDYREKAGAQTSPLRQQPRKLRARQAKASSSITGLVYSTAGGDPYYHTSAHLTAGRARTAMSEEAAQRRGFKPCPVCIRR